jgi:ferritin
MLKDSVQTALNDQVKQEFYSAHVYLSMCAWFEDQGLPGFAKWMRMQYQEELGHGIKIFDFINDRDGKVIIEGVEAPPTSWASPLAAFEAAYENEKAVSASIDDLYNLADGERDHATKVMLQWFITEQVEEEKTAREIVAKFHLTKDDPAAILDLDRELASRGPDKGGD